ncbi:MerR family transcriptional regulator [Nocardia sp. NPDC052112]|uniref:MerR family transcriptional regulator n=1 Tax=Nocardia sp. NPDC052112 TaxID=3155646 RepID=UPI0034246BED
MIAARRWVDPVVIPRDVKGSRQREGQADEEKSRVLISELGKLTGVSARALRHYEDRGLLVPARNSNGYRDYDESDVTRVVQIRTMISAGLATSIIQRYLECARTADHGTFLQMCPDLRAELDAIAERLDARQAELRQARRRLTELASVDWPRSTTS